MRLAILWTHESRYLMSVAEEAIRQGHPVLLHSLGQSPSAPFRLNYPEGLQHHQSLSPEDLQAVVHEFAPDRLLVAGWHIPHYRYVSRELRGHAIRFMSMDNQWKRTIRQIIGCAAFRASYSRSFDRALVPGPRQAHFARRLGFEHDHITQGGLPCDIELFSRYISAPQPYFLTAARLAPEKGIDTLLDAYRIYRNRSTNPWRLVICGTGSLPVESQPGVEFRGFTDPDTLARLMGSAGAFVLPSHYEPWGVVLHEAAAAGRYIITTTACAAADLMVTPGGNGVVVPPKSVDELAVELLNTEKLTKAELAIAESIGRQNASQASPRVLVRRLAA